ncbi:MAG: exodeoxyribonuclease VII large subunit, partial [Eubacterium sp.]|nr:exodeoxyribonuclease VII large subunit [Eubacterium sp.]
HRFEIDVARLHALSPTAKLINGFGYISKDKEPIKSAKDAAVGDTLSITLSDGTISANVTGVSDN